MFIILIRGHVIGACFLLVLGAYGERQENVRPTFLMSCFRTPPGECMIMSGSWLEPILLFPTRSSPEQQSRSHGYLLRQNPQVPLLRPGWSASSLRTLSLTCTCEEKALVLLLGALPNLPACPFVLRTHSQNFSRLQSAYQEVVPENFPYPCPDRRLWRSAKRPESVHQLRPGDIDVVAAIGDSLTAGNGGFAETVAEGYLNENRGISWSIGGQGTWRQYLTVPNLLKVMNPNLVGYSEGSGNTYSENAQFNVAYSGAMDQDLIEQAVRLIQRMKKDRRVDFQNHWKMLTVMIGTNDICSDQCHDKSQGAETHRRNLMRLLDFLYKNLPKTFVNLVVMPHIPYYAELVKPPFVQCFPMQLITCSCLFGGFSAAKKLSRVVEMTKKFQKIQEEIVESGRYDNRTDFVVVYQPTNLNSHFPKLPEGKRYRKVDPHDYSYVAVDCIHYTQKLHARIANVYWNNLFEDPGNKTTDWETPAYSKFLCPTDRKPYLLTKKNYLVDFSRNSSLVFFSRHSPRYSQLFDPS